MRTYVCDKCKQVIEINSGFYSIEAEPDVLVTFENAERDANKKILYKHLCKPCFINIFGEEIK